MENAELKKALIAEIDQCENNDLLLEALLLLVCPPPSQYVEGPGGRNRVQNRKQLARAKGTLGFVEAGNGGIFGRKCNGHFVGRF